MKLFKWHNPISDEEMKDVYKSLYGNNWFNEYQNATSYFDDLIKRIKSKFFTY